MNNFHAALWSHSNDDHYRITHQPRTKQRGIDQEQKVLDSWTWEEILDGKGPWAQAGEYRRPKAELEAAKAEQQRYEEVARQRDRHERQPPKMFWGGGTRGVWQSQVGDLSLLLVFTGRSAVLVRHRVMRSSARCRQ
jgi:hypothetical protein